MRKFNRKDITLFYNCVDMHNYCVNIFLYSKSTFIYYTCKCIVHLRLWICFNWFWHYNNISVHGLINIHVLEMLKYVYAKRIIGIYIYNVYLLFVFIDIIYFILLIVTFVHMWSNPMHYLGRYILVFGGGSRVVTPISWPRPVAPKI